MRDDKDRVDTAATDETEVTDAVRTEESADRKRPRKKQESSGRGQRQKTDRRNIRMGRNAAVTTLLVIAIVIVLNVLLQTAVGDKLSWDVTSNQLMSLGDVSQDLLADNDEAIRIVVLGSDTDYTGEYAFVPELLKEYEEFGQGNVSLDYIDPVAQPQILVELDPDNVHGLEAGQIVVYNEANGRLRVLTNADLVERELNQQTYSYQTTGYSAESSISGAINYVTLDRVPTAYVLEGHGIDDLQNGFTLVEAILDNNGYVTEPLNLITAGAVPEDASMVLIIGMDSDLSSSEATSLRNFLEKGGGLLVAPGAFRVDSFDNLNSLLAEFNIALRNDRIRENNQNLLVGGDNHFFLASAPANDITAEALPQSTLVSDSYFVDQLQNPVDWISVSPLLQTSDQATRETGGDEGSQSGTGVQNIALMSENTGHLTGADDSKAGRVVVLGSSSIISDEIVSIFQTSSYNYYIIYGTINWLSNEETGSQLMISSKPVVNYTLTKAQTATPRTFTAVLSVLVLPLILITATIAVYRRRRHL